MMQRETAPFIGAKAQGHMEVLLLLQISAFSFPGKPSRQATARLESSAILIDCLFWQHSETSPSQLLLYSH